MRHTPDNGSKNPCAIPPRRGNRPICRQTNPPPSPEEVADGEQHGPPLGFSTAGRQSGTLRQTHDDSSARHAASSPTPMSLLDPISRSPAGRRPSAQHNDGRSAWGIPQADLLQQWDFLPRTCPTNHPAPVGWLWRSPTMGIGRFQAGRMIPHQRHPLRCRIRARMRRFLRPSFRRPFPVFFTPMLKLPLLLRV
jgi:hypothetical protein